MDNKNDFMKFNLLKAKQFVNKFNMKDRHSLLNNIKSKPLCCTLFYNLYLINSPQLFYKFTLLKQNKKFLIFSKFS